MIDHNDCTILLNDSEVVRNHFKQYRRGGLAVSQKMMLVAAALRFQKNSSSRRISIGASDPYRAAWPYFRHLYYHLQSVTKYLPDSKVELIFYLPYALDLSLIKCYWRFFKKEIPDG